MNIDKAIRKVEEQLTSSLKGKKSGLKNIYGSDFLVKGKKLRARTFLMFSGKITSESIKIATAIELLHTATLIHDDIVDNTKKRRGSLSLHAQKGIVLGVLCGDYLFSYALSMLMSIKKSEILNEAIKAASETLEGEILEQSRRKDLSLSKREYLSILKKKSGSLFAMACKTGSMIKGESGKFCKKAFEFGSKAGVSYQIMDDILDYFGDHSRGKEKYNDLKEGIVTLPLLLLIEECTTKERSYITRVMSKREIKTKDICKVIEMMQKYDIESISRKVFLKYNKQSIKIMPEKFQKQHFESGIFSCA